jgi:hypothetical protein
LRLPIAVKNAKPEVTDRFQDGRRCHVRSSSACYKLGNYYPISIKTGAQTKKHMLSSKITEAEVQAKVQDGRQRHIGQSSACYKKGNYHPILI